MRKNIWYMAVGMILFLVFCVATLEDESRQLIAILAAALVACVYIICESRVERANAPLVIRDESAEAAEHPPDCEGK